MKSVLLLATLTFVVLCPPTWAYTPDSPEVQRMVLRGVAFLEQNAATSKARYAQELGASCVAALAHLQAMGVADHPLVQRAVTRISREIRDGLPHEGHGNYSLPLAAILLCELNHQQYRPMIETLLAEIYARQTPAGAWTYPGDPQGDTSQTQFAVLAIWMANQRGIPARRPAVEKVCNWLLRVQAPDGVYPYKGEDPGGFQRIPQQRTSMSMCTAGIGSLYACGELLGLSDGPARAAEQDPLPPAVRRVASGDAEVAAVDRVRWRDAIADGNRWLAQHAAVENRDQGQRYQQYYFMYAVERYRAFREQAEGGHDAEPAWYNAGVDYLREHQAADNSWESTHNGPVVDTAFAVLFLLRSARRAVQRDESGTGTAYHPDILLGDDSSDDILDALESGTDEPQDTPRIALSRDSADRAGQLARLRRLLVNGRFQARLAAAELLGKSRDLDNAPYLIFALSDPDYRVAKAARDSLRFISRMPQGFGFEIEDRQRPDQAAWREAQRNWSLWLLSIKPDAEFVQ